MWRAQYQAPPQVQALALDTLSKRQAVPTILVGEYEGPPLALQFTPAWNQPPPPQGFGAILSKLAVVSTLAPPFAATVLGRVEQFYPAGRTPPQPQDQSLTALTLRQAVPTLLTFTPLGNVPQPPFVQPPAVQTTTLAALTLPAAVASPFAGPFAAAPLGNVPPPPWVQPPTVQTTALAALSKLAAAASPFAPPFGITQLPDPVRLLALYPPWRQPPAIQPDVGRGNSTPVTPPVTSDSGYLGGMPTGGKKKRHPMDWPPRYIIEAKAQQAKFEAMAVPGPLPLPPDPKADRRRRDMDALIAILAIMDD